MNIQNIYTYYRYFIFKYYIYCKCNQVITTAYVTCVITYYNKRHKSFNRTLELYLQYYI